MISKMAIQYNIESLKLLIVIILGKAYKITSWPNNQVISCGE